MEAGEIPALCRNGEIFDPRQLLKSDLKVMRAAKQREWTSIRMLKESFHDRRRWPHIFDHPTKQPETMFQAQEERGEATPEPPKLWDGEIYAKKFSESADFRTHLESALTEDMRGLLKEAMLNQKKQRFEPTRVNPKSGEEGNGYHTPLEPMVLNYVQYCMQRYGNAYRAVTEHLVQQDTSSWALKTADENEYLIWISPPSIEYGGSTSELKNPAVTEQFCSKIYIKWSEKSLDPETNEPVVLLHTIQLTGWPNYDQLIACWEELNGKAFPTTSKTTVVTDLIGNLTFINDKNLLANQVVEKVSEAFFKSQDSWEHAQEMPKVSPERFWKYQEVLWQHFYLPKATVLLNKIPPNLSQDHLYWQTKKAKEIINSLDLVFQFYWRNLEKFVKEEESGKPEVLKLHDQYINDAKNRISFEMQTTLKKLSKTLGRDINLKVLNKKLREKEIKQHQLDLSGLLNLADQASAATQCYTLAPFTMSFNTISKGGQGGGSLGSGGFSIDGRDGAPLKIASKEYEKKFSELQKIRQHNYVEITLTVEGKEVNYMVPDTFLERKGCFVETIDGKEVAMGPCDIPLDLKFEDENENIVYKMSQSQFTEHVRSLEDFLSRENLQVAEKSLAENPNLTTEKRAEVEAMLSKLKKILFKRSIGLSDFVASVIIPYSVSLEVCLYFTSEIADNLRTSLNPLKYLEELMRLFEDGVDGILKTDIETVMKAA